MHAHQKCARGFASPEKMVEDRAFEPKRLRPAVAPLAHGIFQMRPHRKQDVVRIENVACERTVARPAQISRGHRLIGVPALILAQESEAHAGIQQALDRLRLRAELRRQRRGTRRAAFQMVENAQHNRREHGFRTAEGLN